MINLSSKIKNIEDHISQGDVFKNVRYIVFDSEDIKTMNFMEYEFPLSIVISQSCDVEYMYQLMEKEVSSPLKYMPSILLCPIYYASSLKNSEHLKEVFNKLNIELSSKNSGYYTKDDKKISDKNQHTRFLSMNIIKDDKMFLSDMVIDFKHVFSVSMKYLLNCKSNRLCTLDALDVDLIVNKFSSYVARIGLPDKK